MKMMQKKWETAEN